MSEDKMYKDTDIVWVKLGNNWWPGEVTDVHRQPEGLIQHFKKKPYCVVRFFDEDSYEYVKSSKQIFPFQCQKKEEFIKKGLALFNAKNKFMEKFPSDVEIAESLTRTKNETTTSRVDKLSSNHPDSMHKNSNLYKVKSTNIGNCDNYNRNSIQYLNIIPNQRSTTISNTSTNNSHVATELLGQSTSNNSIQITGGYNSNVYKCNICNFTSLRQNVMIFHRRTHTNTITTVSTVSVSTKNTISTSKIKLNINKPNKIEHANIDKKEISIPKTSDVHTRNNYSLNAIVESNDSNAVITELKETTINMCNVVPTKARITHSRRSRELVTSGEDNISQDDKSSTKTENTDTDSSKSSLIETIKKPLIPKSTTPVSKANSEELRQRLLADWSDEDNGIQEEKKFEKKSLFGDDDHLNSPLMSTYDTTVSSDRSKVKSLKRIRNIPKKDRRELILKEFNSDIITKSTVGHQYGDNYTSPSGEYLGDELKSKKSKEESFDTETDIKSNININHKECKKIISCFDFPDDDDDNEESTIKKNKLKSISNFKKKLLAKSSETLSNPNEQETNRKFNELSAEIDILLQQSSVTVSDVDTLQSMPIFKMEGVPNAAVKDLPIKERGKRIFKSRNRTQSNVTQSENTQHEESEKNSDMSLKNCVEENDEIKYKAKIAKNEHTAEKLKNMEENLTNPKLIDLSSFSISTDSTAIVEHESTHESKIGEEERLRENGSSSVSEVDAEFGSPTSILDDDRLPIIANNLLVEKEHEHDKETTNEISSLISTNSEEKEADDEEIESPPHEELSGNELEAEINRMRNIKKPSKSPKQVLHARTPTPKKYLTKQYNHTNKNIKVRNKTRQKIKNESLDPQINISIDNSATLPTVRKRRGHMKITPYRIFKEKTISRDEIALSKRNICRIKESEVSMGCKNVLTNIKEPQSITKTISGLEKDLCKTKLDKLKRNNHNHMIGKQHEKETIADLEKSNDSLSAMTTECLHSNNIQQLLLQSHSEVNEEMAGECMEMKNTSIAQCSNKKYQNDKIRNKTSGIKRKHGQTITINESKVNGKTGNDNNEELTTSNNKIDNRTDQETLNSNTERRNCDTATLFTHPTKEVNKNNEKQTKLEEVSTLITKETQEDILSTIAKARTNQTPEQKESIENNSEMDVNEQQSLDIEEDHHKSQSLTAFGVDDGHILEMQSREQDENPKFLAVPTYPIHGYNETFLLCTVENNQYKPIDGMPLYLDQDLNQLQPVPLEALEGQSVFIVNQAPAEGILSHPPIKNISPTVVAEEETQMLCLPTQVTDIMAEAAAATVSTVMTPALVRGNESNLQLNSPINTTLHAGQSTAAAIFLMGDEETATTSSVASDLIAENAIIVNVNGQQVILEGQTLTQLLANPEGSTQLITEDGTEFVMTRDLLIALEAQQAHEAQQQALLHQTLESPSSQDILAVALAGSDLYGNDMLEVETSQTLQLVCTDGFQAGAHLTPPITAQTSETNALLNQTPIMSTLEVPTSKSLPTTSAAIAAKLKADADDDNDITTPNLEDSLAVIGVTTQSSAIPTSLELPITVTNPAIAPKVSLSNVLPVSNALLQFGVNNIGDASNVYNDPLN